MFHTALLLRDEAHNSVFVDKINARITKQVIRVTDEDGRLESRLARRGVATPVLRH
jgi:hypothetical protein